ncbi:MAG: hypothetical protein QOJ02_2155 [Acidobacteriota bacterium]|jgi:hypothetical protein|nr:hypothetical protein [Acidobacteriota bacterium]
MMRAHVLLFEVMDKEPSLVDVWLLFTCLGAIGFALCRFQWQLLLLALPVSLFLADAHLAELYDRSIWPAILHEAGHSYFIQSYVAMAFAVLAPCLGALSGVFYPPKKWR